MRRPQAKRERPRRAAGLAGGPRGPKAGGGHSETTAAAALPPDPVPGEPQTIRARRARPLPETAPVAELQALQPQRTPLARRLERERRGRKRVDRTRRARAGATVRPTVRATAASRRARPIRRRELVWPTAKAGFAVTVALALAAGLGSFLGLPAPGLDPGAGGSSLVSSASLFGLDPGTPPNLAGGFVYPVGSPGPHDYGEEAAKFHAPRSGHIHEGQDIFAKPGTPLFAVRDGVVLDGGGGKSFYPYGGGNSFVMYSPTDDRSYVFLHMLRPSPLKAGDRVHAGQEIGQVGCTGSCDGPHLHFEIRLGRAAYGHEGKPVDPLPYLQGWEQLGTG